MQLFFEAHKIARIFARSGFTLQHNAEECTPGLEISLTKPTSQIRYLAKQLISWIVCLMLIKWSVTIYVCNSGIQPTKTNKIYPILSSFPSFTQIFKDIQNHMLPTPLKALDVLFQQIPFEIAFTFLLNDKNINIGHFATTIFLHFHSLVFNTCNLDLFLLRPSKAS